MQDISGTVLARSITKAEELGGDRLSIEYKDRHEEVCAMKGFMGFGIEHVESDSDEGKQLREMLYALRRRKRVTIQGVRYRIKVDVFDSFGEDAFEVEFART